MSERHPFNYKVGTVDYCVCVEDDDVFPTFGDKFQDMCWWAHKHHSQPFTIDGRELDSFTDAEMNMTVRAYCAQRWCSS